MHNCAPAHMGQSVLHCTAPPGASLHCPAVHSIALQTNMLHNATPDHTAPQNTAAHRTAMHDNMLHSDMLYLQRNVKVWDTCIYKKLPYLIAALPQNLARCLARYMLYDVCRMQIKETTISCIMNVGI